MLLKVTVKCPIFKMSIKTGVNIINGLVDLYCKNRPLFDTLLKSIAQQIEMCWGRWRSEITPSNYTAKLTQKTVHVCSLDNNQIMQHVYR